MCVYDEKFSKENRNYCGCALRLSILCQRIIIKDQFLESSSNPFLIKPIRVQTNQKFELHYGMDLTNPIVLDNKYRKFNKDC